ncbi:MAG: hypothetical protein HN790_15575 [Methylococcales bacterium]|jgi:hypothetical protein|nr:hypothetical protein [Methylococcales bacterium]
MMKNLTLKILTTAVLGLTLTGCNTLQKQEPSVVQYAQPVAMCSMPSGKRVDAAFAHAKSELSSSACQTQYHNYFTSLIDIAKGDPSAENKQRFSQFVTWSYESGIISKRQGRDYYTQYFSPTFTSLSDTLNVCSASRSKQTMIQDMQSELKMKKQGILEVAGDRDGYFKTLKQHSDIVLVLEATAMACTASL